MNPKKRQNKYIVLCVDESPSMGYRVDGSALIDLANCGIAAFCRRLAEAEAEGQADSFSLVSLAFSDGVPEKIAAATAIPQPAPIYAVQKQGKACMAALLSRAVRHLMLQGRVVPSLVLITDGVLDPGEDAAALRDALYTLTEAGVHCYAAGFTTEHGIAAPACLLDFFTDRQLSAVTTRQGYIDQLTQIADAIIAQAGAETVPDPERIFV